MASLNPDSPRQLLVVLVPSGRSDDLVDLLMGRVELSGFSRSAAAGFSREHSRLSLRESVQGYRDQVRFEVLGDARLLDTLLAEIADLAGRDRFHWWRLPVLDEGSLGSDC